MIFPNNEYLENEEIAERAALVEKFGNVAIYFVERVSFKECTGCGASRYDSIHHSSRFG